MVYKAENHVWPRASNINRVSGVAGYRLGLVPAVAGFKEVDCYTYNQDTADDATHHGPCQGLVLRGIGALCDRGCYSINIFIRGSVIRCFFSLRNRGITRAIGFIRYIRICLNGGAVISND